MLEQKIKNKLLKMKVITKKDTVTLPFIHKTNGDSFMLGGYGDIPFIEGDKILLIPYEGSRLFYSLIRM